MAGAFSTSFTDLKEPHDPNLGAATSRLNAPRGHSGASTFTPSGRSAGAARPSDRRPRTDRRRGPSRPGRQDARRSTRARPRTGAGRTAREIQRRGPLGRPAARPPQVAKSCSWCPSGQSITNCFVAKNPGDPWLSFSVTLGRARQIERTRSSMSPTATGSWYREAIRWRSAPADRLVALSDGTRPTACRRQGAPSPATDWNTRGTSRGRVSPSKA